MSSDAIAPDLKGEMCRGVLELPDEIQRMALTVRGGDRLDSPSEGPGSGRLVVSRDREPGLLQVSPRPEAACRVRPGGSRRRAAGDVIDVVFLDVSRRQAWRPPPEVALDLIRGHAEELEDGTVKRLLARAIKTGLGPVRQSAYRVGAERFGLDYAGPALKDKARSVSDWARKYRGAGKTKRSSRSAKRPGVAIRPGTHSRRALHLKEPRPAACVPPGRGDRRFRVGVEDGQVAHLAAGGRGPLAVEVELDAGVGARGRRPSRGWPPAWVQRSPSRLTIAAGIDQVGAAQRQAAEGADLLLELAGRGRLDRQVPRVVRARARSR